MKEKIVEVKEILKEFNHLPRFEDGRIDYSHADKAPVLICFVQDPEGKILLLKRSDKVIAYKGLWSSLAGFIDEEKPLEEKVLEELEEELKISREAVIRIRFGEDYEYRDEEKGKIWWRFPMVAELSRRPEVVLDWEHTDARWIGLKDIGQYELVPGTEENLRRLFG